MHWAVVAAVVAVAAGCGLQDGLTCVDDECCSKWGYCGVGADYCGEGCQTGYGRCVPSPSPNPAVCGNGACEETWKPTGETCGNCPQDCGPCQPTDPVRMCLEENTVALTFDDGPVQDTLQLLKDLQAIGTVADVPATFFALGIQVDAFPDSLAQETALGYSVGSHSYHHPHLPDLTMKEVYDEFRGTEEAIARVGSPVCARPVLYRPPYGETTPEIVTLLQNMGYRSCMWGLDTRDWDLVQQGPNGIATMLENIAADASALRPAGFVSLEHDFASTTDDVVAQVVNTYRTGSPSRKPNGKQAPTQLDLGGANASRRATTGSPLLHAAFDPPRFVSMEECMWGPDYKSNPSYVFSRRNCSDDKSVTKPEATPLECPVSQWSEWSPCDAQCGEGTSTRVRYPTPMALADTHPVCANGNVTMVQARSCTTGVVCKAAATARCTVGAWGAWGPCSSRCGTAGGTQTGVRLVLGVNASTACGPSTRTRVCFASEPCRVGSWQSP